MGGQDTAGNLAIGERGVGENEEGEEGGGECEGIKVGDGDSRLRVSNLRQEGTIIGKQKREEDNSEDDGESGERGIEDVDQG